MKPTKMYRAAVRLPWAKKRLEVGEQFEAPMDIGEILVKSGKATADAVPMIDAEVMARATKPVEEADPKPVRTYQRRDMVAEQPKEASRPRGRPAGKGKRSRS